MEDQLSVPENKGISSSRLRYPLRSSAKSKPPSVPDLSAPKSGRSISSVSKSVNVLDFSGKDKSGKPPRRLSALAKPAFSPLPRPLGNVTPISETKSKTQAKNGTPNSEVSRSSTRKKFCVLSSASYWLTQIKLSESAAKHNISVGLFKLALEAGCEPFHKMRDELKVYSRRHNLAELGEPAKQLLESYNILENPEPQVSETVSQVLEEGSQSSDGDVNSSSSVAGATELKPKGFDVDATCAKASPVVAKLNKKIATFAPKIRAPSSKKSATNTVGSENVGHSISKKSQKLTKKEPDTNKRTLQKEVKKISREKAAADTPIAELLQENKENMMEESSLVED